jgi:hypothetical protein
MITDEKLGEALELISKGITRPTKIAKAMGISYRSYCGWMVKSNAGDEKFLVTFNGEQQQWARAITLATKLALFELRGMILEESVFGYDEIQTKDGQVVWAIDPAAAALPEEDREWLGYRKDALLEVDGKLQPVVIKRKAPFAQQIRLLEAAFPDLRPSQTINQNINGAVQVGVGFAQKVDYSKGPPAVPPPPPRPELPAPVDAEFSEVDAELEDGLVPVPVPVPPVTININLQAEAEAEPERVIVSAPTEREKIAPPTAKPIGVAEVPLRQPRNDLERDLFARLAAAREKAQS